MIYTFKLHIFTKYLTKSLFLLQCSNLAQIIIHLLFLVQKWNCTLIICCVKVIFFATFGHFKINLFHHLFIFCLRNFFKGVVVLINTMHLIEEFIKKSCTSSLLVYSFSIKIVDAIFEELGCFFSLLTISFIFLCIQELLYEVIWKIFAFLFLALFKIIVCCEIRVSWELPWFCFF